MAAHSKKVVIAALLGNGAIATIKFIVAAITRSSAMLAEAVHSLADTGNQALLLLGIKRSTKPADELHPFGYGQEQYFWSFVVANMLFFIGAVVSIYEGVRKLGHPHPIERAWLIYIILGVSFVIEGTALTIAYREFNRHRPSGMGLLRAMRRTKDTSVLVVLLEDSAALSGLLVAFFGVLAAELTGMMIFDAIASIAIGLILGLVALVLAWETKDLLIGEAATREDRAAIRAAVEAFDEVQAVGQLLTMHLAPSKILVAMDLEFSDGLGANAIEAVVDRIEAAIREKVPAVDRIFIEAEEVRVLARRTAPRS